MFYAIFKKALHKILGFVYQVEVKGLDNYAKAGDKVLIISNHTSFLDPLLLGVFLPDRITFAINTRIAQSWIKYFLFLSRVFTLNPNEPLLLKALIKHLQENNKTVVFPEGRITVTGSLMKIYDGAGMVADKSGAKVLPIRIHGAEYTHFSRLRNIVRLRLFPKITLHILPPTSIAQHPELSGKARRKRCGTIMANLMTEMIFASSYYQQTILSAVLTARTVHGGRHIIAEDMQRQPLSYNGLLVQVLAIASVLRGVKTDGAAVGVFLPNSSKTLAVILALQLNGNTPAMLNFSSGWAGMLAAVQTAKINTIISSRRFVNMAKIHTDAEQLAAHTKLIYLEDLAKTITLADKLRAVIASKTANWWYQPKSSDDAAVILFTSGSEGQPKGVVLSHSNILANHQQLQARLVFSPQDVILNVLPMFHSFGFCVGTLFPLVYGMKTFFYPTPLHYSVIPEIAYDIGASILFGTNTFLAAYGGAAHVYDFYNMRYVVAGAEKLQDNTKHLWADKFGIRILEGYGATETAPVLSVNTPMDFKIGSVGKLLPGIDYQLQKVDGIDTGGQLHVKGANIMAGYLLAASPGQLQPPQSIYGKGWYDTGDIVNIDEMGFVTISGRSKRFAKISGEMVSLAAIEAYACKAWTQAQHATTAIADTKKGERIILLTTQAGATSQQLSSANPGVHSIGLPKQIITVPAIPLLGNGKVDYPAVGKLAAKLAQPQTAKDEQ